MTDQPSHTMPNPETPFGPEVPPIEALHLAADSAFTAISVDGHISRSTTSSKEGGVGNTNEAIVIPIDGSEVEVHRTQFTDGRPNQLLIRVSGAVGIDGSVSSDKDGGFFDIIVAGSDIKVINQPTRDGNNRRDITGDEKDMTIELAISTLNRAVAEHNQDIQKQKGVERAGKQRKIGRFFRLGKVLLA